MDAENTVKTLWTLESARSHTVPNLQKRLGGPEPAPMQTGEAKEVVAANAIISKERYVQKHTSPFMNFFTLDLAATCRIKAGKRVLYWFAIGSRYKICVERMQCESH